MKIFELFFLGLGLSVDAFTVSLSKGLSSTKTLTKTAMICGLWFAVFQSIFPLIGYYSGQIFEEYICDFDHWFMFAVFIILGINLIREAFSKKQDQIKNDLGFKSMFLLSLATSIDSLAVGVTLAFVNANIWISLIIISLLTFVVTVIGVYIGHKCGKKYKKQATFAGGILLIALAIEILIQHIFF